MSELKERLSEALGIKMPELEKGLEEGSLAAQLTGRNEVRNGD